MPPDWGANQAEENAQREQDLDAARQMSRARAVGEPQLGPSSPSWGRDAGNESGVAGSAETRSASIPMRSGASTVARRQFYQQPQHGSTSSVDSQTHYIDHRNQSHSLSMNPRSPLALRAAQGSASMSGSPHVDASGRGERRASAAHGADLLDAPEPPVDIHALNSPPQQPHDMNPPTIHEAPGVDVRGSSPHAHSQSPPLPIEDDVCFPLSGQLDEEQEPPAAYPADHAPGETPPRTAPQQHFDFSELEQYADGERERVGTAGTWPALPSHLGSPSEQSRAHKTSLPLGLSPENPSATLYSRRPRRAAASRAGEGGNKYQRKLAMFEGSPYGASFAGDGVTAGGFEPYKDDPATPRSVDAAARPLLTGATHQTYHGVQDVSDAARPTQRSRAHSQPTGGKAPNLPAQDKPYRFTFYSNALPNTIHARYLSELPAPGQSFEELFSGVPANANEGGQGGTAPNGGASASRTLETRAPGRSVPTSMPTGRSMLSSTHETVQEEPNTWWLDVLCPTDQEMKSLSKAFGIHPLTTEDILMEETREKIELFRNYYLVCFRSFDQNPYSPTYLEPLNMYIIVFREGTLSFHFRHTTHPQNVRRRIKQLKDYINVTSDWISYALIDDITDAFGPLIQSIEFEVDSIDELVLILKDADQSDMLRRIGTCRKKVMGLLRLMGNKADVVKGLAKRCNEYWSIAPKSDIGLYLSDIQDHLITMTQNLNHYEMILSRSHSNYLAQISIEMTDANNQINDVLSKLTALGTVIVPMNVITGLWGMNVQVPGQNVDNLHWFGGIVAVMVVIAVVGYLATVRYLERR